MGAINVGLVYDEWSAGGHSAQDGGVLKSSEWTMGKLFLNASFVLLNYAIFDKEFTPVTKAN